MIHLVTHCYAASLPQYATFLHYQLSSLALHRPRVPVVITVCWTRDDQRTAEVLRWFYIRLRPDQLDLRLCALEPGELFRRAIGRNRASRMVGADLVWFTDVDHCFGRGCLDALWEKWRSFPDDDRPLMLFPRSIQIMQNHAMGDELADRVPTKLVDIRPEQFVPKRYHQAIGGVQIACGKHVREHGYLASHRRYQRPRTDGRPFADFRDDIAFRRQVSTYGRSQAIDLPGLYRLRHTQTTYQSRDFTP